MYQLKGGEELINSLYFASSNEEDVLFTLKSLMTVKNVPYKKLSFAKLVLKAILPPINGAVMMV